MHVAARVLVVSAQGAALEVDGAGEGATALDPVLASGLMNDEWTERLLRGSRRADPAAVDFLLNMQVVTCRVGYSA